MFSLLLAANIALAEEATPNYPNINVQTFRPSIDSQYFLWVSDSNIMDYKKIFFRGVYSYTQNPLMYTDFTGQEIALVSSINQMDLIAGSSFRNFRIGVSVPLFFSTDSILKQVQSSSTADIPITIFSDQSWGVGDLVIDAKYQFLDSKTKFMGAMISARGTLPTNSSTLPLGTDGLLYECELGLDKTFGSSFILATNIGYREQPVIELEDIQWGPQIYSRTGLAVLTNPHSGLALEYITSNQLDLSMTNYAHEALLSTWQEIGMKTVRVGLGIGLNPMITVPEYRLFLSVGPSSEADADYDGVGDSSDICKFEPEDKDGVADDDGCPEPTKITVLVLDPQGNLISDATWSSGIWSGLSSESFEYNGSSQSLTFEVVGSGYNLIERKVKIPNSEEHLVKLQLKASDLNSRER